MDVGFFFFRRYCLTSRCYTPTEFALFGIGICVLGILIGVVAVAFFRSQCVAEEKLYEYSVDDGNPAAAGAAGGAAGGGGAGAGGGFVGGAGGGAVNPFNAAVLTSVEGAGPGGRNGSGVPNGDIGQVTILISQMSDNVANEVCSPSCQDASLLSHSDSGGFISHKADSVVAVAGGGTISKRDSHLFATEADSLDIFSREDKRNGNAYYGAGAAGAGGGGAPLETMM